MSRPRATLLRMLTLLVACASGREAPAPDRTVASAAPAPADSLVLRTASGTEVWFTGARPAADSAGVACVERTMQIRRDSTRINIPLLYTGAAPTLVNDSTLEAAIWLHCRPGNVYRVNLRTGLPERVR